MIILTFEDFNNKIIIDNNAMSDIRIKDIEKHINLAPIEIVMRDQTPDDTSDHIYIACNKSNIKLTSLSIYLISIIFTYNDYIFSLIGETASQISERTLFVVYQITSLILVLVLVLVIMSTFSKIITYILI